MGSISRRQFLAQASKGSVAAGLFGATARGQESVSGANERLSVAMVGTGARGSDLMAWAQRLSSVANLELTAVCDLWDQRRESAVETVRSWTGRKPRACRNMAEVCDLPDVDAVIIATADFQHAPLTRQAVEAGKDVYVEKPLGNDFEQIKSARQAVHDSGRIVQLGTQMRSEGHPWAARDFVRAGRLGQVSYVNMIQPLFQQRWRIPGSENSLSEEDTDWNEFLSYTPKVPFDARKYREFRLFWPYSTGIFCQWMSHIVDLVNLILGQWPSAVTAAGGVYVWNDGRTNPDTVQALVEYPNGTLFSYHMRLGNDTDNRDLTFYGTQGTLDLYSGIAYGNGGGGRVVYTDPLAEVPELVVDGSRRLPDRSKGGVILNAPPDGDHMLDFFHCVRSRKQPKADIEAGYGHALATTMAGLSWRTGARIEYDPIFERIVPTCKPTPPATRPAKDYRLD